MKAKPVRAGFWPKVVLKKLLNISTKESDFIADERVEDNDAEGDDEDNEMENGDQQQEDSLVFKEGDELDGIGIACKLRRRNSFTLRQQYINRKEIRVTVGTWNVGGIAPPDDLDISEWISPPAYDAEPSDIYVLGFQEIVPLNAGNVFGAEDRRPAARWEEIIRSSLARVRHSNPKFKCFSAPSSPTRFDPPDDTAAAADLLSAASDTDSDSDVLIHEPSPAAAVSTPKRLDRLNQFKPSPAPEPLRRAMTARVLSRSEKVGLVWPERPLDLLSPAPEKKKKKRRETFAMVIGKQMVGIFVSVWVRQGLRKHIHNPKVSTVGVGAIGYMGNKGSVSVSMSVYQTPFCFVCTHLSSGERHADAAKRNADVHEIHRRTLFRAAAGLQTDIYDHERVFWLGDMNYRIDIDYAAAHEHIGRSEWEALAGKDQLRRELEHGGVFAGWAEGALDFAPTYKYEVGSGKYVAGDEKGVGRRTPAWCDRVLSYGKGVRRMEYRRAELRLSDHRPVAAVFAAEVEVVSCRKLQRAMTLTNKEIDAGAVVPGEDALGR